MTVLRELRPALLVLAGAFILGSAFGGAVMQAYTAFSMKTPDDRATDHARYCMAAIRSEHDRTVEREVHTCNQRVASALNSDLCTTCEEPPTCAEGPFVPIGGWCAEADRWCARHGERSLSCSDARVRCRLYARDAGPR